MAIEVVSERENPNTGTITLEVCPFNEGGECRCERDADGQPVPGHPLYHFASGAPEGTDAAEYAAWRREHALQMETTARGGTAPAIPEGPAAADPAEVAPELHEPADQDAPAGAEGTRERPVSRTRGGATAPGAAEQLGEAATPPPGPEAGILPPEAAEAAGEEEP